MNILQLSMDEVHPYGNNPRKNDNAVEAVAASIKQYGFLVPEDGSLRDRGRAYGGAGEGVPAGGQ